MEQQSIFSYCAVKVSRRVSDGFGSKWTYILEELDEQLNLKVSFKNKTHVLEGNFPDIIKAHKLISDQLELQNIQLPDESLNTTLQSGFPSMMSLQGDGDSSRLSVQGSYRGSLDLNHVTSGSETGSRTFTSTPLLGQQPEANDSMMASGMYQSLSETLTKSNVSSRTPTNTPRVDQQPQNNNSLTSSGIYQSTETELSETMTQKKTFRGQSENGLAKSPVLISDGIVRSKQPPVEDDRPIQASSLPNHQTPQASGETSEHVKDEAKQQWNNLSLDRQHSSESFASSMPSLERAPSPDVDQNHLLKGPQAEDTSQANDKEKRVAKVHDGKDDIHDSLQRLETEYKNAKILTSDGDTESERALYEEQETLENDVAPKREEPQQVKNEAPNEPEDSGQKYMQNVEAVYVDTNTWKFMQLANQPDLETISRKYKVSIVGDTEESDLCCVTITPRSERSNVQKANADFSFLYQQTMNDCVQYPLKFASQVSDSVIEAAVKRIKEIYPRLVIVPGLRNSRELTFVCHGKTIKEVADNFRELVGMIPPRPIPGVKRESRDRRQMPSSGLPHGVFADVQSEEEFESEEDDPYQAQVRPKQVVKEPRVKEESTGRRDKVETSVRAPQPYQAQVQPKQVVKEPKVKEDSTGRRDKVETSVPAPQKSKDVPKETSAPRMKVTKPAAPTFDISQEEKKIQLSKSQSPSLQLLYELLTKDSTSEIEEVINKILNGEAVTDLSSTQSPIPENMTSTDKRETQKQSESESESSEESSDDDLYGAFRKQSKDGAQVRSTMRETEPVRNKGKEKNASSSGKDKGETQPSPKLSKPVASSVKSKTESEGSSSDEDLYGSFRQVRQSKQVIQSDKGEVQQSMPLKQKDDKEEVSSSSDDDLYQTSPSKMQQKKQDPVVKKTLSPAGKKQGDSEQSSSDADVYLASTTKQQEKKKESPEKKTTGSKEGDKEESSSDDDLYTTSKPKKEKSPVVEKKTLPASPSGRKEDDKEESSSDDDLYTTSKPKKEKSPVVEKKTLPTGQSSRKEDDKEESSSDDDLYGTSTKPKKEKSPVVVKKTIQTSPPGKKEDENEVSSSDDDLYGTSTSRKQQKQSPVVKKKTVQTSVVNGTSAQKVKTQRGPDSSDSEDSSDDDLYGGFKKSVHGTEDAEAPVMRSTMAGKTGRTSSATNKSNPPPASNLNGTIGPKPPQKQQSTVVEKKTMQTGQNGRKNVPPVQKQRVSSSEDDSSDDDLYGGFKKSVQGIENVEAIVNQSKMAAKAAGATSATTKTNPLPAKQHKQPPVISSSSESDSPEPFVRKLLNILPAGYQPPNGDMHLLVDKKYDIPGHPGQGAMVVTFNFEDGEQAPDGLRPRSRYKGARVSALVPNSVEGKSAYKCLRKAFDERKLFTIDDSDSTSHVVSRIAMKAKRADYPAPGYVENLKATLEKILA